MQKKWEYRVCVCTSGRYVQKKGTAREIYVGVKGKERDEGLWCVGRRECWLRELRMRGAE